MHWLKDLLKKGDHTEPEQLDPDMMDALDLLRGGMFNPDECDPEHEARVIRRVRLDMKSRATLFWLPAIVGGVAAATAALAIFQLIFYVPDVKPLDAGFIEGHVAEVEQPQLGSYLDLTTIDNP